MKAVKGVAIACASVMFAGSLAACASGEANPQGEAAGTKASDNAPLAISLVIPQVGDIPAKGNAVEQAIETYTNTKLDIQWVPNSAYEEKVNIMIASNELPKVMKLNYTATSIGAINSGLFWEIGPYLKDYKNLSAQNPQHYDNIMVEGKVYGVPLYRDIARAAYNYRKDWFDELGLQLPKSLDDWYKVQKALAQNDPDKNGKNDTYGMLLDKKYLEGNSAVLTRLAVSMGGVNKWGLVDGKMTPEFMTKEYVDVLKMFRKFNDEKLLNSDFAAVDPAERDKVFDSGRAGLANSVAAAAKSQQDRVSKTDPKAVVDNAAFEGPQGIRLAGESGNNGFLAVSKSAVKTEEELKKILTFLDKLMDEPMATLQLRGIEGTHFVKVDGKTEFKDFTLFQREVKPYRDNLLNLEGYNVPPLKDTPLGEKAAKMVIDNQKYVVPNLALTLTSHTYSEQGKALDQMIWDAQTKYIMGKIDDAGWEQEVNKWLKAGGEKIMSEYDASYAKLKK
ncbi:extracellular solute-binding protein [Paenibacillus sp. y28]|uniref:extracellular solute-binding protein n=1 Tax=Paenibacillus sp. y28 TaxID=3129110 RepID=UPI003019BD0A